MSGHDDRSRQLQRGEALDAGDRVVTPLGAGVVVYRRMQPPEYSRPAAFSVKLDGKEHEGTMVSAVDVRWEGWVFDAGRTSKLSG